MVRGLLLWKRIRRLQLRQLMEHMNDRKFMASAMERSCCATYGARASLAVRISDLRTPRLTVCNLKKGRKSISCQAGRSDFDAAEMVPTNPDELILDSLHGRRANGRLGESLKPMPFGHGVACVYRGAEVGRSWKPKCSYVKLFRRYLRTSRRRAWIVARTVEEKDFANSGLQRVRP